MRKIISFLLPVLFAVSLNAAVGVKLAWDPKPVSETWTEIHCYERTGAAAPFTYTSVATAPGTATSLTVSGVSTGTHTYIVRSFNGQQESTDSNAVSVTILPVPGAPTNVTTTVILLVQ